MPPIHQFILFLLCLSLVSPPANCQLADLYVVPPEIAPSPLVKLASALRSHTSRHSPSSSLSTFPTVHAALSYVEQARLAQQDNNNATTYVTIHLYPTTHYLATATTAAGTLRLTTTHSHLRITTMSRAIQSSLGLPAPSSPTDRATISGGIPFPAANWTLIAPNTYTAPLPRHVTGPVVQLFTGSGQRIPRTRLPMNFNDYYYYNHSLSDTQQARYGFVYNRGQFDNFTKNDIDNAMVVVYHSWTASRHYIDHVYKMNQTVMFTNPADRFIGYFTEQSNKRFHIENVCSALQANTFCYNNATRTVILRTDGSYDPTNPKQPLLVTPFVLSVMTLIGISPQQPLTNVLIDNINVYHSDWSIGRSQQADAQSVSWSTTAGLMLTYATQVLISNVNFAHHGVYGIYLLDGTVGVTISECIVTDSGGGGIRIGQMEAAAAYPTSAVSVLNTEISFGGQVHYDGVGILVHRAIGVDLLNNHIHHLRYTGISVGWSWGYSEPSGTANVIVGYNFIHDIGQHVLNDMGGIYCLGVQDGTVITNNVIHSVYSYANYMWGVYLDEGSSRILVANNVVYHTGWGGLFQHYGANNTITNNVFAAVSLLPPQHPGDQSADGATHIGTAENHISWTYFTNIVYYPNTTLLSSNMTLRAVNWVDPTVVAPMDHNVYYAASGALLTYGANAVPFSTWQAGGHDAISTESDPGFIGAVDECELFDVSSGGAAGVRGFANITRPAYWVAGCGDELEVKTRGKWRLRQTEQSYQWMLH